MKTLRFALALMLIVVQGIIMESLALNKASSRQIHCLNMNWKFHWGDIPGAQSTEFPDSGWNNVKLPHDWSIEMEYTRENTAGCTGYLPGGIGWYRKEFSVEESLKDKVIWIEFDGIYRNADVWINGHFLGNRPYGYSSFKYDLTKYLHPGSNKNVIAVRVNRSEYMDSRWYPGSGIYRDVRLVTTSSIHLAHWGTFITTPIVTDQYCKILISTQILNETENPKEITLQYKLLDRNGDTCITSLHSEDIVERNRKFSHSIELNNPLLWSTEDPAMYSLITTVWSNGIIKDKTTTPFGIRTFNFDSEKGFSLNGKNMKMKGVCLHHDGGCVGAAVPLGVWRRRFEILKDAGVNAIRTAHNPPSPEFLDLCDQMGFLVQVEAFDEWSVNKNKWIDNKSKEQGKNYGELEYGYAELFEKWAERDIKDMVQRDRNHPSVIMWSIGNEIEWTFPYYWHTAQSNQDESNRVLHERSGGNFELVKLARQLNQWIKEVDTTRPTTAGEVLPEAGNLTGYCDVVDITGYNYMAKYYDDDHKNFPSRIMYGSENFPQWQEWKDCIERDYISGVFLWPGISYLGEAGPFPRKASSGGLLDLAGFKNPVYHFFKTFWQDEPLVYMATQKIENSHYQVKDKRIEEKPDYPRSKHWGWPKLNNHWNYETGEIIYIEAYTNAEEAELFLNNKSLGSQKLTDNKDRLLKWAIPFQPGVLRIVSGTGGKKITDYTLQTADKPSAIKLTTDKSYLVADGKDVLHLTAQLVDEDGIPVKHINKEVRFKVEGDAYVLGVDNGSSYSVQSYQSDVCMTEEGKCLLLVQSGNSAGRIIIEASGIKNAIATMNIEVLDEK